MRYYIVRIIFFIIQKLVVMNSKFKSFVQQLLRSPREFPIETVMGIIFFFIALWHLENRVWNKAVGDFVSGVNVDILAFFVPLIVLTYWLNRLRKRQMARKWQTICISAYVLSGLLFLPLLALDLKPFIETLAFGFTYVLAAILLVVGTRWMDNRSFAAHTLHVTTQLIIGCAITGLLNLVVMAIVASFIYIFGLDTPSHLYEHIISFVWFVLAPQVCFTLITQDEDEIKEPAKPLRIILDFILSPAVIIYTVILYLYFITIAVKWDLPKGNVAWLITGFISAALVGRLMQYVLTRRHYDWFYTRLPWIAIPPLVMYWIGSIYRISIYSFTESRFYLIVAGVLMTLFVVMLFWHRSRRFQLMALITAGTIVVFTYIPSISARSIGFRCQVERFNKLVTELKLTDAKTGRLLKKVDLDVVNADSVLCSQYSELSSIISYVRKDMGYSAFERQYGQWNYFESDFRYGVRTRSGGETEWVGPNHSIDLGAYNILLVGSGYAVDFDRENVVVTRSQKEILRYPINDLVRQHPELMNQPDRLCVHRNDSILLVLSQVGCCDSIIVGVSESDYRLFKKRN